MDVLRRRRSLCVYSSALSGATLANMSHRLEPLIDVKGAARILHVHPNTVVKMLRAGALPGLRLGRFWRIPSADLEAWLARQKQLQSESTSYPELSSNHDGSD